MIIYYFSATGNSLKAALDIAKENGGATLIAIKENMTLAGHPADDKIGFVFPVYMGLVPDIARKFITDFPLREGAYYFSVLTYYLYKGMAQAETRKLFRDKGVRLNYINSISTVGNCLMEYEVSEKRRKSVLEKADKKGRVIGGEIKWAKQHKANVCYSPLSKWMHQGLFNAAFKNAYKKFSLEDSCIACGKCVKICPVNNITLTDGKPVWGKNCHACHACVHWCPKNAINLGSSKGRLQYRNPAISYKQLV